MPISMYQISVPVFIRGFSILSSLIAKAEAYATEKKIDPSVLFSARLAPDMLPFAGQIQRASDTSKATIGRLTDVKTPSFPDNEASFADLKTRIANTVAFLEGLDATVLDGSDDREVTLSFGENKAHLNGHGYMLKFALPNFFFHITTAHDILRHNGVPIGKLDYLGAYTA
ncbi:DUF1993 domain-containing protein [Phyllobacterium sp. 628]|uniref:DUF1993 domain-containing protein n=1 Tax=Phyllobacterium sp. 628 TaxID=2718938 RepID=UPI0016624A1C|nr:DUF1993 domain-containing protein [Phyllobacterium sp. 628]QND52863.1 DUF1993 domain-containing protein [Phyllobacterium sp. 628]